MVYEVYTVYEALRETEGGIHVYYEVYIDSLLLVNFVMNLLCLGITNLTFHRCAGRRRLVAGAALGAVLYILPFLLPGRAGIKMFLGFAASAAGMIAVTFHPGRASSFWKAAQRLLFSSFLLGGSLLFFVRLIPAFREGLIGIMSILGIAVLLYMEISYLVGKSGEKHNFCRVELVGDGPPVEVTALLDTGNSLREPFSGKPVCILDKNVFERLWEKEQPGGYRAIPYHSVGKKHGILPGYLLPEMRIELDGIIRKRKNVYIGISEEKLAEGENYAMILNPLVLKEE